MSRIGKKPIPLPSGVKIEIGDQLQVTGPKGTLTRATHGDATTTIWSPSLCERLVLPGWIGMVALACVSPIFWWAFQFTSG